ncbi:substrate-binding periplasmic protein [Roseibium sp. M-1]
MCTFAGLLRRALTCLLLLGGHAFIPVWADEASVRTVTLLATDYPPYEMAEPVEGLRGFDHEVVTEAFARQGWQARIVFLPWNRAISEVQSGKAAGVISCAYWEQREEFALYSKQLSSNTYGVFFRKGYPAKEIARAEDLAGENVGAVQGYATLALLNDAGVAPYPVPDDEAGVRMLEIGRIDYFFNGRQATDFLIKQLGLTGTFSFISITNNPLYICLSKAFPGSERLLTDFNRGLAAVKTDGTYTLIHAKYQ